MTARYRFTEQWWFEAAPERVAELLDDVEHYHRWWPAVQALPTGDRSDAASRHEPAPAAEPDVDGPRRGLVVVRAPLGYRLRIVLTEDRGDHAATRVAGSDPQTAGLPSRELRARVSGDLTGAVRWRIGPEGNGTRVDFEQRVTVARRWLRWGSPLLRPVFARQHARVMAAARAGLERALGVPDAPLHDRAGRGT